MGRTNLMSELRQTFFLDATSHLYKKSCRSVGPFEVSFGGGWENFPGENSWVAGYLGGGQGFRKLVKGWGGREGSWRRRRCGRKGGEVKRPEGLGRVESAQADLRTTVPLGDRAIEVSRTSVSL